MPSACLIFKVYGRYILILFLLGNLYAEDYYVDSNDGNDGAGGTSEAAAWRTLEPVRSTDFQPGDVIHFKRGSSWSGDFVINNSGEEGNPITFTAYGEGDMPVFSNPGGGNERCIYISADWIVLENLKCEDSRRAGIYISSGSDHNVVQNCESEGTGFGCWVGGSYNLVTSSYFHDLNVVNNTPGGDDDYGAVGVVLSASNNEISYNRMVNCVGPSYDYGVDGGVWEVWTTQSSPVSDCYIHHNTGISCDGFLEVGGSGNAPTHNMKVAYNVSINNGTFCGFHMGGTFGTDVQNYQVENNTVYETEGHWSLMWFNNGDPTSEVLTVRNNIFHVQDYSQVFQSYDFTHEHNLYHLVNTDFIW
jgi:hypothetical protein